LFARRAQTHLYLEPLCGQELPWTVLDRLYPICAARRIVLQIAQIETSCKTKSTAVTSGYIQIDGKKA